MRKKILGIKGLGTLSALALGIVLLLSMVVMRSGCDCGTLFATPDDEYNSAQAYMQNVVAEYMVNYGGLMPPHGDMINTSECFIYTGTYPDINAGYVLDFCYLFNYCTGLPVGESCDDYEYFPFKLPICCYGQAGQEGTNFYTGNCTNPYNGHYIWLVDIVGYVCSVCIGDDCWANNESGYQGVWP